MKKTIFTLLIFCLIIVGLSTCIREDFKLDNWDRNVKYDADFAIPLAYGDLTYYDIDKLAGGIKNIRWDEDGLLSLYYEGNYSTDSAYKHFIIPQANTLFKVPAGEFKKSGNNSKSADKDFVFTDMWANDVKLTSITFGEGACVTYTITPESASLNSDVLVTFSGMKDNKGNPFVIIIEKHAWAKGVPEKGMKEIADYTLTLDPGKVNTTSVKFLIDGTSCDMAFDLTITGSEIINGEHKINWKRLEGDFGEHELISKRQKVSIDVFKEGYYYMDRFWFEDPKMTVDFTNGFGVPANFAFDTLRMINVHNVEIVPAPEGNAIPYATTGGIAVPLNPTQVLINRSNSNIQEVVSKGPRWVDYYATLKTKANPNSFVDYDSQIEAKVTLELPLWGDVYHFTYADTSKFELPKILKEYDPVKRAGLRVDIKNGFPADMKVYVYLVDTTTGKKIDDILILEDEKVLKEAKVDGNLRVIAPEQRISRVEVTRDNLEKWKNANGIVVKAVSNTTDVTPAKPEKLVKVYKDYKINFRIGIDFDVEFNENIDSVIDAIKDTAKN